jgi:predicted transcriptional regulator
MVALATQKTKPKKSKNLLDSEALRQMLKHSGLTQAEFGVRSGIAARTIRRYVSGVHKIPLVVMITARVITGGR